MIFFAKIFGQEVARKWPENGQKMARKWPESDTQLVFLFIPGCFFVAQLLRLRRALVLGFGLFGFGLFGFALVGFGLVGVVALAWLVWLWVAWLCSVWLWLVWFGCFVPFFIGVFVKTPIKTTRKH